MKKEIIYIFHEQGTQSHYRALTWQAQNNPSFKIKFREFSISKKIAKAIISLNPQLLFKQIVNILFIFSLAFRKKSKIIVGIAPYDWRLFLYYSLLKRHNYFYHTSKTTWGYNNYSKRFLAQTNISKKIWKNFIENSRGIFCVSKQSAKELEKYYQTPEISIVNHAIPDFFKKQIINNSTSNKINCLFVGRYTESKGICLIFDIIDRLPKKDYNFTFVGNGELNNKLNEFCGKHENCFNLGYKSQKELLKIYDENDVLLLPSIKTGPWEELFGMVLIEAMARGLIPIATNHSGPKEIIDENHNGFIFSESDYIDNCEQTLLFFFKNKNFLKQLKHNSLQKGQTYSPENIFRKWELITTK